MHEAAIRNTITELNRMLEERGSTGSPQHSDSLYEAQTPEAPSLADDLSQLRMKMKYVLFDLEATRRENRYLRQMLEMHRKRRQSNPDAGTGSDDGMIM
jgi:hypothetical protein